VKRNAEIQALLRAAPEGKPRRSGMRALAIATGLVMLAMLTLLAGIAIFGTASGAEPHIRLTLDPLPASGDLRRADSLPPQTARKAGDHLISDFALLEDSPDGPLPKIAEDGRRPMTAYGRSFLAGGQKRIAVVMTGAGISKSGTELALSRLPPDITLSFAPAITGLQGLIDQARGKGHEVLLEIPMEPFDYPESDPGPNTLMVAQTAEENVKRLRWNLARATGYAGIGNLLGGRFLGDRAGLTVLMSEVAARGLLFFDNGRNTNSLASEIARSARAPISVARISIDDVQTQAAIDQQLSELEAEAARNGASVGVASVFPITIDRLAAWSEGLAARGFVLAPLTAVTVLPADE
jgi:polysaccharide deacetylase 2 family uncharacterized protein YibQ